MPSDQQVTAQMILQNQQELERSGSTPILQLLEQIEPDLASYLMEELTGLYHRILNLGASAQKSRRLYRRLQKLVLICILALRKGHLELWRQQEQEPDPPQEELDPPA